MKLPLLSLIFVRGVVPAVLVPLLAFPSGLFAQATADDHLVTSEALQHQVQLSSAERAADRQRHDISFHTDCRARYARLQN